MQVIKVLVPNIKLFPLDYIAYKEYKVGDLVIVPFRNKQITGIVWETNCSSSFKQLKEVSHNVDFDERLPYSTIELIKKAAAYYLSELGTIAKLVLPVDVFDPPIKIAEQNINLNCSLAKLSHEQMECLNKIESTKKPLLIKGITGSGKTEIYFHAVMNQLKINNQALIMLPEVSLSEQIISRFVKRFGFKPAIWNSKVTKAQKKKILLGIIKGTIKVVIGARSALFLPYKNLGIIVVDEEHDTSYKQSDGILYNARDMSVLRGKLEHCKTILVSATPSIESIYNCKIDKYELIELTSRFNNALLPNINLIDMRHETLSKNSWISKKARDAIYSNLANNQQTLIFLNRRGYAPLILCKACGYKVTCKHCSASMVMHKEQKRLECHHCGNISKILSKCLECKSDDSLILCGPGIERIEEEIKTIFPKSRTAIVSKDKSIQDILLQIENSEIDILIGTQLVTKGYHFPNLTLVIVVDADIGFAGGELRAAERNFQLLHQVSGRAGREKNEGTVFLQTYLPDNKVIKTFIKGQDTDFIEYELETRKASHMPPFSKAATITFTGKNAENTKNFAKKFLSFAPKSSAKILGPAEAFIHKISGKYRYKILVIANKNFNLQKYLEIWKTSITIPSFYHMKIDIDPQSFL